MELDALSHVVARFTHAMQMLVELIPYTDRTGLPRVVEIACLEDWFTNHRLLIEFVLLKPPTNCAGARDLVPGWVPATDQESRQLRSDYGWASEDVSHIGVPKPQKMVGNTAPAMLRVRATFLLDVIEELVTSMERTQHQLAPMTRLGLTTARSRLLSNPANAAGGCSVSLDPEVQRWQRGARFM